jgi:hypothetical protein
VKSGPWSKSNPIPPNRQGHTPAIPHRLIDGGLVPAWDIYAEMSPILDYDDPRWIFPFRSGVSEFDIVECDPVGVNVSNE